MTGGKAPYAKGAAHERDVAAHLRGHGALVVRSPQSGQAMDLTVLWHQITVEGTHDGDWLAEWAITFRPTPWLVQCKMGGYMRPAEREELIELAKKYGARPILVGRKPYTFIDLTTGGQVEPPHPSSTNPAPPDEVPDREEPD
jgi:hypothetical protein